MLSHVENNNYLLREKIFLSNYPLPSTNPLTLPPLIFICGLTRTTITLSPRPQLTFPNLPVPFLTRASTKQESGRFQLRSLIFVRLRPIIDIYAAIIDDAATRSEGAVIVASIIEVNRWLSICIGWLVQISFFCISTHRFGQIYYIGIQYSLDGWLYHRSKI